MSKFKVGDEVFDINEPGTRAVVARCKRDDLYLIFSDGSCGLEDTKLFRKTGRHFELRKILKKLR